MAIRQPPSSIKDANLRGFLQELRNAIGKTGEQVNQVAMRVRQITNTPPPPTEPPDPGPPSPPGPPAEPGDGLAPPAPISLTTTPDAWAIRLTWEQPADMPTDYDVTEIWCRNAASGDKRLAGSLRGNSFVFSGLDDHLLETGETWYFWVRNKDVENLFSAYYPNNDDGVSGQALPSPTDVIGDITSDIVDGTLFEYLGAKVALLQGPEGLPGSVSARLAEQKDQLVQQINEISVSSNGTIDTAEIWHFDTTAQGWTVSGTGSPTVAWSNGVLVVTAGSATATVLSPTISVSGPAFHFVRARLKQTDTNEVPWTPTLAYKKSGSSTVYTYTPVTPAGDLSGFVEQDWEVADEETPVWTVDGTTITQVGFQLAAGQQVRFDWVAVGRLAPGASYSQVEAIRVRSDKKNRVFYQTTAPTDPYTDGYNLVPYDLWFDIDDGNKPYRWNPPAGYTAPVPPESPISTHWAETTDKRLADSWAEIYDISTANANPSGAAAQRINGIGVAATTANTAVQNKAWRADVDTFFANDQGSTLAQRLSGLEASSVGSNKIFIQSTTPTPPVGQAIGDLWYDITDPTRVILKRWGGSPLQWVVQRTDTKVYYLEWASRPTTNNLVGDLLYATDQNNKPYIWNGLNWVAVLDSYISTNINAAIVELQRARIGYATVAIAHTYLNVTYAVGTIFEGNGTTDIYPAATYPANTYPQYAAARKIVIDEQGVLNWNEKVGITGAVKWNTGLPLAQAVKQVRVSDGATSATIEQQFFAKKNTDDQLLAQYSVKIDNNGWVSGFGLSSEPRQDGSPFSEFGIRADRFWIAAPSSPSLPNIGVGLASLTGTGAPVNGVIGFVSGRLTSAAGTAKTYAYFQPADLHGLSEGDWFTLKNIRASSTTTSDNYHTVYNGSFVVAKIQGFIYTGSSGSTTLSLPYVGGGQTPILFEVSPGSFGYKTSQTDGQYSDLPKLIQQKYLPFIVTTTQQTYNGATVPIGVFMNNAYIANATITNAKIADAAITMAKITKVIQSANFDGGFKANGDLDPANPGTRGWALDQPGTAIVNALIVRTGNLATNAVTNIIANSTNGLVSWRPADLAYPIAVPLDGTRGRIALIITITIQAPGNAGCAVFFQAVVNGVRRDFKVAYSSAANGYGSCTIITYDNSLSTTMNIGLDSTVVGGAPAYWSWGYILMDIKR